MKIFLETSLLSDVNIAEIGKEILEKYLAGDQFYVSALTHFQLLWGYSIAKRSPERYEDFLVKTRTEIAPLTKLDAEEATRMKPIRKDLLDALIASCVKRYDGNIWTRDRDFFKFLPHAKVRVF
ncbi:MAG: PIN domain-containing protein [Thaumarchaeota archaeon]|nr:PIN domain-containing protein [Nitrososphaerota archaeon]